MNNKMTLLLACAMVLISTHTVAADADAGKAKSATCASCHGADGLSTNDLWPNLKGQKNGYLVKQMKAFRDGQRTDPMMSPMAKGLTDEDIDNLAAYYSGL